MAAIDAILGEIEQESKVTQRVLERVPEDKYTWKPHDKSMSIGQLAMHLAMAQGRLAEIVVKDSHDIGPGFSPPPVPGSRKELLDTFSQSTAKAQTALRGLDDAKLGATWTLTKGDKVLIAAPRIGFIRSIVLNHMYHHRGQLSVYLRLLNVPVPSIYGPSADENPFG
jgi:uncharacterized damage-inducible protein DinB